MRKTGREAGWEGVAWAEQDAAVRRKEGDKAAQRTRAKPSYHFSYLAASPGRGQAQRKAAEGKRQPRVMNLWMSLLAKLRVLLFGLHGTCGFVPRNSVS